MAPDVVGLPRVRSGRSFASESGVHFFVYSGADSVSHSVSPNQKVGRSWKFHVPPEPSAWGCCGGSLGRVMSYVMSASHERARRRVGPRLLDGEPAGAGRGRTFGLYRAWPRSRRRACAPVRAAPRQTLAPRPGRHAPPRDAGPIVGPPRSPGRSRAPAGRARAPRAHRRVRARRARARRPRSSCAGRPSATCR